MKKLLYSGIILLSLSFGTSAQNWEQIGEGSARKIHILYTDTVSQTLYACNHSGAEFGIIRWNNTSWDTLGTDLPAPVTSMKRFNNRLCVSSGRFVLSWNGFDWDTLGNAHTNDIKDIEVFNSELYAISHFGVATVLVNDQWVSLNPVWFFSTPIALQTYKNALYICGQWEGEPGNNIMSWDGNVWSDVGGNPFLLTMTDYRLRTFVIFKNELFMSGDFWQGVEDNPETSIARWDGNTWKTVGGGLDRSATTLAANQDDLYAIGRFEYAGGVEVPGIAKWDGTQWCDLGSTFNGGFGAITVYNNQLIIGGSFTGIDGMPISRIAKWVGGNFVAECGTISGIEDSETENSKLTIYPNPTTSTTTLTWQGQSHGNYQLQLYDGQGKQIAPPILPKGEGMCEIDMSALPSGIYFGRLLVGEKTHHTFKVIKE